MLVPHYGYQTGVKIIKNLNLIMEQAQLSSINMNV